ncbi:MAG TPA: hypothetical protein VFW40_07590 [Capsulimonadaceae bacterium]|nr:hypothetical protein [Capsulimonadaceae bacterium]
MKKIRSLVVVAGLAIAVTACAPVARAHDSNTLHKMGNAIAYPFKKAGKNSSHAVTKGGKAVEYPVRKAGENASITAHKATGKSSVVHNKQTGQDEVVTPSTTVTPAPNNSK